MKFIKEKEFLDIVAADGRPNIVAKEKFILRASEVDRKGWAQMGVLLSYFEEIAHLHTHHFNMLISDMNEHGYTWMLNRLNAKVKALPAWRDEVTIYSWQSDLDRIGFYRDFYVFDAEGEALVTARSFWITATWGDHSLVRPETAYEISGSEPYMLDYQTHPGRINKLRRNFADFSDPEKIHSATRVIGYTDIDINDHVNNTHYINISRDAADKAVPNAKVQSFDITYNAELFKHEVVLVEATVMDEDEQNATVAVRAKVLNDDGTLDANTQDSFRVKFELSKS